MLQCARLTSCSLSCYNFSPWLFSLVPRSSSPYPQPDEPVTGFPIHLQLCFVFALLFVHSFILSHNRPFHNAFTCPTCVLDQIQNKICDGKGTRTEILDPHVSSVIRQACDLEQVTFSTCTSVNRSWAMPYLKSLTALKFYNIIVTPGISVNRQSRPGC